MATKSWLYPEQQLRRRAMGWAVKLKVNPEQVQIKRLPGKWGACGPDGVVTLADDLATEADDFQDYVIVHELLHLKYRDHGKQFKAMMTALVPNWRDLEQQSQHATESAGQGRHVQEVLNKSGCPSTQVLDRLMQDPIQPGD